MKRLSGFSLMEMMVVLLIISIVAAASAPMINRKLAGAAAERSPWVWTGNNNSIAYNLNGNNNQTATIGDLNAPADADNSRLHITTADRTPQISFSRAGGNANTTMKLRVTNSGISLNTSNIDPAGGSVSIAGTADVASVAIGNGTIANGNGAPSIAIGNNVSTQGGNSIVLGGMYARTTGAHSILMGCQQISNANNSILIGNHNIVDANSPNAMVFSNGDHGRGVRLTNSPNSIIIGRYDQATPINNASDAIIIGRNTTVTNSANSITAGQGALSNNAEGSISIGFGSRTQGGAVDSVTIGTQSYTNMGNSVTIGRGATSGIRGMNYVNAPLNSIAIGASATASASNATAVGATSTAANNSIAIGNLATATARSTALGADTTAQNRGIAIGSGAVATGNANSIAIGLGARATHDNSIAIGTGVQTQDADQIIIGRNNQNIIIPGNVTILGTLDVTGNLNAHAPLTADAAVTLNRITGATHARYNNQLYQVKPCTCNGGGLTPFTPNNNNDPSIKTYWDKDSNMFATTTSDRRLKDVGKAFTAGLEEIKKLEVFNYTFKKDPSKTPRVGVMAQDLQKIFPQAVTKGEDGFLRIRMEDMFYALVNAVKELDKKIETLIQKQKKIDELESRIEKLEKRLAELEKNK